MKKIFFTFILLFFLILSGCVSTNNAVKINLTNETSKTFTLDELAKYNGENGEKSYISVNNVIYDATDLFNEGFYQGIQLGGTDATAFFAKDPNNDSLLDNLMIIGLLNKNNSTEVTTIITTSSLTTYTTITSKQETLPIFTLNELSQYTGKEGTTAYVAVNGIIYDVTDVFSNGEHEGIQLGGTDATCIFESSSHSDSLLDTLPIVGTLEGYDPIIITTP